MDKREEWLRELVKIYGDCPTNEEILRLTIKDTNMWLERTREIAKKVGYVIK